MYDRIFDLAKELASEGLAQNDEVRIRSAISRAYYAVFLTARDRLNVATEIEAHTSVIRAVRSRYGILIGSRLYDLKVMRTFADYSFSSQIESADLYQMWELASQKATQLLNRLKT